MNTHTSKRNIWLRSIMLLPIIAFSIYGFSEKKEIVLVPQIIESIDLYLNEKGELLLDDKIISFSDIEKMRKENSELFVSVKAYPGVSQEELTELMTNLRNVGIKKFSVCSNEEFDPALSQNNLDTNKTINDQKVKVIKGGNWSDVEHYLKQDKKVINDIHIHIDKNDNIYLNDKSVTLKTVADKVNALNTHLSTDEKRKFLNANITLEDDSQIQFSKQITYILVKECNVYNSSSSNIETQKKFNLKNVNSNPYAGKSIEEAKEIYENETLDFSIKEQPKNSPWSITTEVNDVKFIELDEEPVTVKITEVELKEYNSLVKKFNALPKDKRIIKLKDFERMSYIYSHLSEEQKKKAEPYPQFYKE